jgi:hypothetical protein
MRKEDLDALGTKLLKRHGFAADGTPLGKRVRKIWYETMPAETLESLRQVPGIGGAVHRCTLGNRPNPITDPDDSSDNELTLIELSIERS